LISRDEFHFVVVTAAPALFSEVLNSLRCVVLPDPSGASKATSRPRPAWRRLSSSRQGEDLDHPCQ
jgi:hypothetical protein